MSIAYTRDPPLDDLLQRAANDGWALVSNPHRVEHICDRCAHSVANAQPMFRYVKGRGSVDPTNRLSGFLVSGQTIVGSAGGNVPAGAPVSLNSQGLAKSVEDTINSFDNPVFATSSDGSVTITDGNKHAVMTAEQKNAFADKCKAAERQFGITINLLGSFEDDDDTIDLSGSFEDTDDGIPF